MPEFNIEEYREPWETGPHWELKREFMEKYQDDFSEDRLICLAQAYSNIELMDCRTANPFSKKIINAIERRQKKHEKKLAVQNASKKNRIAQANIRKGDIFVTEIKDLWADEGEIDSDIKHLITFRDEYMAKRTPKVTCHRFMKPSLLPAIEVPAAGQSYNPDYDDHQDLLREAHKVELAKQKHERHLKRVLDDCFPSREDAPTEASIMKEMSQGLFDEGDENEEDESENVFVSRNPPVKGDNRLTKQKRRRRKELKKEEKLRKLKKIKRIRANDINRIPKIKREIKEKEEKIKKTVERNLQRRIDAMYKPKVLSAYKYEAPDLELNLTKDLAESMRALKTEGNLLEDRYKSLQRRNIIETRVRQKFKRRYKLKKQVKRSHRDDVV